MPQKPRKLMTVAGRLFQARIWREYAQAWDVTGVRREWLRDILKISREDCLRRCRVNIYLARRLNRRGNAARIA